jgi:glycine cleavage system aminomethyltransferase T
VHRVSFLDFLSPDLARDDLGFMPLLRSSMERRQREAGARFDERDGWLVPVALPGEAAHLARVGIGDLSHLGKVEVRGAQTLADVEGVIWHRVTSERAIGLHPFRDGPALRERLATSGAWVLDATAAYAVLAVVGPESGTVMRRLTHLHSFPASGDVAHVAGHVLERRGGFAIVFPQEYGHYLWEVAVDHAEQLGGGPVGVDALERSRS